MSENQTNKKGFWCSLYNGSKRKLYGIWAELYTRYQENFSPDWREPLPPMVCQLCGKPGHLEKGCPNAKGLGFLD